jgi:modification methylase
VKCVHKFIFDTAVNMDKIPSCSIDLVVTSPPYPMIEMWDDLFISQDKRLKTALKKGNGTQSFELMHTLLDPVWEEAFRVIRPGGFACINIGDATRKLGTDFSLYSNHSRIVRKMTALGFSSLPLIIWRKQTNAPNKFMGSGMLPAGAYVTLEHEYILIFRKGAKREFKTENDKQNRQHSAMFWEERNQWFSDVWLDLKGTPQAMLPDGERRLRSAAFPLDLPFRIINMYSVKGDMILDPFLGSGTTALAAMASSRDSIGFELDPRFRDVIFNTLKTRSSNLNAIIEKRVSNHKAFVRQRRKTGKNPKYKNAYYDVDVVTRQEKNLYLNRIEKCRINKKRNEIIIVYSDEC